MSFNVLLQLTLEVECFLADGTFPILDPFVDHLMLGPCGGSPEGFFATKPALVLLLAGVAHLVPAQGVVVPASVVANITPEIENSRYKITREF